MSLSSINSFENHEVDVNRYITYVTPMQNLCTHCCFCNKKQLLEPHQFYTSANGATFSENPPTIRSDSNYTTLRFTSDESYSEAGILMCYELSECLYWKMLNINPFMDGTYHCYPMRVKHNDNNNNLIFFSGQCDILSPCQNGATCLDEIDGYQCKCTDKWIGINCTGIWNIYLK